MKIFITRLVPKSGLKLLKEAGIEYDFYDSNYAIPRAKFIDILKKNSYDAILSTLTDKIDSEILDAAGEQLKIVANYAVGYGNIDLDECTKRGIAVSNTPDVLSAATADMAFALLLATARKIIEGHELIQNDQWLGWTPTELLGQDLSFKTLGIIGMGRIGEEMAKRALGFNMKVVYYNRSPKPQAEKELGVEYSGLNELLAQSDFISLHCPLTPETKHLIGKKEFEIMKEDAIIINTARGAVINEQELVNALQQNQIWGAGLDVFEYEPKITEELKHIPNVVLAPHLGSATKGTRDAMLELAVKAIIAVLDNKTTANILNKDALTNNS